MKNFDFDIKPALDACQSKSQRLSIVMDDIFEENLVPTEEQFPVFWGFVEKRRNGYHVSNLRTLGDTPVRQNPYVKQKLSVFMGPSLINNTSEEEEVCVIVGEGPLKKPHELLNIEKVFPLSELGVTEAIDTLERINYLFASPAFLSYKDKMKHLLETRGKEIKERKLIDILTEQKHHLEDDLASIQKRIEEVAPEGLSHFENELKQKESRYNTLSEKIEEMEVEIRKASFFLLSNEKTTNTRLNQDSSILYEDFANRLDHSYDSDVVIPFLMGLCTNQIITLYGPPGKGKTTFVSKMAKAIGAKYTIISVQSNWTDSADLLGYYSPINKTYEGTPFIDALIAANAEWIEKGDYSRLHVICLDEMNLARMEYYFATFLSALQLDENDRNIKLLPSYIEDELNDLSEELWENNESESNFDKKERNEKSAYLLRLKKYRGFKIPPNVHFVGTINNDDTTNELSPKVRDRSLFINLSSVSHSTDANLEIADYYPVSFFSVDSIEGKFLPNNFENENNRFKYYAEQMLSWVHDHLPDYVDEEQNIKEIIYSYIITDKLLPMLRKKNDFDYEDYDYANKMFNERSDSTPGDNFDLLGGY